MKYVLTGKEAKAVDEFSINKCGIPSIVLMERAALAVSKCIMENINEESKLLFVCGNGNNGADGLAVARQVLECCNPKKLTVLEISNDIGTNEYELQKKILNNIGITTVNSADLDEYDLIVDAIFGIGLSRNIEGEYARIINCINASKAKVVSVDIPSGIDAATGRILGAAVKADWTVTFEYAKVGMILYPGAQCCGDIRISQIGFAKYKMSEDTAFAYDDCDLCKIPKRVDYSNKGTYGKVFIAAGSKHMGGAACLAAESAYRMGCGLVKVYTHENNREAILKYVPEAIVETYGDNTEEKEIYEAVKKSTQWADSTVIGPGISTENEAEFIVKAALKYCDKALVLDADALNIISDGNFDYEFKGCRADIIITPHVGEMSRLCNKSIALIKNDFIGTAMEYAIDKKCICLLKDARSFITDGKKKYINVSGNNGMSTGGSGDVLTGIIAALLAMGMMPFESACLGAYIHGKSGDKACEKLGAYSMKAGDIVESIHLIMEKL